ncbi:MAG: hypothetical protein ACOYMH_10090 [Zwartia sp.]
MRNLSHPEQHIVHTELAHLCDTIETEQLTSASIILVGDVLQAVNHFQTLTAAA